MINIASSQPVHWPAPPTSVAVAPVAAVTAVAATQRSQGEGQSGLGSDHRQAQYSMSSGAGQKKAAEAEKNTEEAQAAPILPRAKPEGESSADAASTAAQASQQAQADKAAEEDKRAEQDLKLLDVLSTVWKASAAVVERALGRDEAPANGVEAGAVAQPAIQSSGVERQGLEHADGVNPLAASDGGAHSGGLEQPTSYSEHGASEWGGLEAGRLVSKRA